MAWRVNGSSTRYFQVNRAVITNPPFTVLADIRYESDGTVWSIATNGGPGRHRIAVAAASGVIAQSTNVAGTTTGTATAGPGLTAGKLYHVGYRAGYSTNSREAFQDGVASAMDNTFISVGTPNRTFIGATDFGAGPTSFAHNIVHRLAVWSEALEDEEIREHMKGKASHLIRPWALVWCPEMDAARGLILDKVSNEVVRAGSGEPVREWMAARVI